ncbi:MAG: hypothetical protein KatS3mg110_3592 [Pirellulaceae bacterium]|nr:MAG: hypothetical protein KatS3mg110_3592 [Pirellulaceae bacterium]
MLTRFPRGVVLVLCPLLALTQEAICRAQPVLKSESFDRDPGWEGFNNRIVPQRYPTIVQDFGFSLTHFAGIAAGEIGGQVWRASEPAYYAARIPPKTLHDRLTASGTFVLVRTASSSGVFFGFFRAQQPGAGGRPVSSIGLHFDCEPAGARLAVRLITGQNQSCGTFITPYVPGQFRPAPLRVNTPYTWSLDYDPDAADGRGRITFTLRGETPEPGTYLDEELPETYRQEARQRFPNKTHFTVELPDGFKQQPTTFDHFGLMNMMKPGNAVIIYFDDLAYNGHAEDFSQDPGWNGSGNRARYQATDVGGAHDYGYSDTDYAGGIRGELGGRFWRSGKYSFYADRIGPLTLEDQLEASGRVVLKVGAPDSDMFFGWFNSREKNKPPTEAGHFLGIHVGGPTRVGHYFRPTVVSAQGTRAQSKTGPVLLPDRIYQWRLVYDPDAAGGRGAVEVTLADESVRLVLTPHMKQEGARFDRFGMFTPALGGQVVKIYFDDLKYSSVAAKR